MSADPGLIDWVTETAAPLGTIHFRRMMGGATLYCDGVAFAIVALDALWFKADAASDPLWDAAGAPRFTYARKDGRTATMNYRRAPDDCYDDADSCREWAALGWAAGRRAAARKTR